ncbi:MAG: TonB-dependent receptor [Balneolales bacterium]
MSNSLTMPRNDKYRVYVGVLLLSSISVFLMISQTLAVQADFNTTNEMDSTLTTELFYSVEVASNISLKLENESVEKSLKEIARQTGLKLTYVGAIVSDKKITISRNSIGVSEALAQVLEGTKLRPKFSRNGYLLITSAVNDENDETEQKNTVNKNNDRGSVIGTVVDALTGKSLPGATVLIEGTTHGTSTDLDGRFLLRRVPVGDYLLIFRYMGYEAQEIPVSIVKDEQINLEIELEEASIQGDDIIITANQRGQARSLTRQRESVNIRSIVSSEQIDAMGVGDVSSALSRVVGMGHGGANIRGVGAGASNITMDGQRMGSTSQDRSVDLSTISVDMVQELDVIKVITPDMDADAMSGVINISTRRPIGGDRSMNVRVGGGMQDRYFRHTGSQARASISYGDSPNERFTYGVNFSYQRDPRARESVDTDWEGMTFDEGRFDVLSGFRTELRSDIRNRYAAGFQMTFQPTDRSTYHVQSMFNYQEREITQHGLRYNIRVPLYTDPNRTGLEDAKFRRIDYQPRLDEPVTHQYTVQLKGRHLLNWLDMEYNLGWGHGRNNENSHTLQLRTRDEEEITYELTDSNIFMSARNDEGMDHRINRHLDNEYTGKLDFEAPFNYGKLKFGTHAIFSFRVGEGERFQSTYDQRLQVGDFDLIPNAEWRILDRIQEPYRIPWMIDMKKVKELYYGQRPHFASDGDIWAMEVETSQYDAEEHTFGVYVMGDVTFRRFTFLGGARVEKSINVYDGREGSVNSEGRFMGATDVSSSSSYINFFPNAQMVYSLSNMTNVRTAYSRSIGRPNFSQLSPNIMRNYSNETIRQGNPDLNPMLSHNLDFIIDHYFMDVGQISLGLFYKNLSDFIFSHTGRIRSSGDDEIDDEDGDDPRYEGWQRTTFLNGREANVYGLELSWQQSLSFLPGFLGNLGTYANYAYTQSLADIGRRHPDPAISDTINVALIDQRPHVLNAGLSYEQGRFSSQLLYHWSAPSVSSYGSQQWVPQIHQRHREYFDAYSDAANDVSLTIRFRISTNFRIWADASNMLNNKSRDYFFDRGTYPRRERLSGRRINVGLRYTF